MTDTDPHTADPIVTEHDDTPSRRPRYRRAIILSVIAHIGLAIVLLMWYLPNRKGGAGQKQASAPVADDGGPSSKPPPPQPAGDVPAEQIEKSLESQIEQAKKLPDEQKLSELEKNLKRLNRIADEQSVKAASGKIASVIGLDTDQYQPKASPAAGPFDANSAQLQDVTRSRGPTGAWRYKSVLVDDQGRTMTVPMAAADGETVYNTFQQMNKFPLAKGIYRSVVMPLIQKMLNAEDTASKAAVAAERLRRQDESGRSADYPD